MVFGGFEEGEGEFFWDRCLDLVREGGGLLLIVGV